MPDIFEDRTSVEYLSRSHPEVYARMMRGNMSRIVDRKTIHFCGLVNIGHGDGAVFLPRNSRHGTLQDRVSAAKLLMKTLARYGQDTVTRTGETHEQGDTSHLASIIYELAQDFIREGIYTERQQRTGRQSGKTDWKKTIARSTPIFTPRGVAVFAEPITTKFLDSRNNPLSKIHAAIMREIAHTNSWWVDGLEAAKSTLESFDTPDEPRALWKSTLLRMLPTLYASRATRTVRMLMRYLEGTSGSRAGEFYSGVEDFERVWETILRQSLPGVEEGWNTRLPKPVYEGHDGRRQILKGGMEMDVVMRENAECLAILDAKYYGGKGLGSVPGTPDIVKQIMYRQALEAVLEKEGRHETVSNAFVLPWNSTRGGPLLKAGLYHTITDFHPLGGDITIFYVDILAAMEKYVARARFITPPWLG